MPNLQDWLARYLASLERDNASHYTVKNYGTDIAQFLDYCSGEGVTSLAEFNRDLVRVYMETLDEQGHVRASIARRVFELRAFGDFLVRHHAWQDNLFRRIYAPRLGERLPHYLSEEEVLRLIEAPDISHPQGLRDRAILEVLYASGVRVSELVALSLPDIDFATGEMRVIGKGDKERVVLLGHPALAALRAYLDSGRPMLLKDRATEAVFLNRLGGRLSVRSVDTVVRRSGIVAGIVETVTPHLLRHTFATHLLEGGADLRVVQELLGHESVTTTQIYANVTNRRAREVYLRAHPRSDPSS
jgi:site-specific recombinase XerD